MNKSKLLTILISITLLVVGASCSRQEEPVSKKQTPKITKVNYEQTVEEFNTKLISILQELNLNQQDLVLRKEEKKKEEKIDSHQFSWTYNYRKLEVPLFGAKGKLLSQFKEEIIQSLREEFPVVEVSWQSDEKQKLVIDLGFKAEAKALTVITHQLELVQQQPKAKIAIVIDDFGFNRQGTKEILSINRPLTMAVLPFRPYSKEDAKQIKESGHQVILHQPLEPQNPEINPGKGAIYIEMKADKIKETVSKNLDSLPHVLGINHHMGSKASTDSRVMKEIMKVLKKRDLFYLDSSTSHKSVGAQVAKDNQVPTTVNYLFIDNIDTKQAVKEMLLRLGKIALRKEELVIIGHVRANTAQAIEEVIPQFEEWGIKLVFLSQLVKTE